MTNLSDLLRKYWGEVFHDNVTYLSAYKFERSQKYPGAGYHQFTDFRLHKQWLREQTKKYFRRIHNDGVLSRNKPKPIQGPVA